MAPPSLVARREGMGMAAALCAASPTTNTAAKTCRAPLRRAMAVVAGLDLYKNQIYRSSGGSEAVGDVIDV
jgi:hypothetical protein